MSKARLHNAKISLQWFDDDIVGGLPPTARLLLLGLYCLADRSGTVKATPEEIQKYILKYDTSAAAEVEEMLTLLFRSGLLLKEADGPIPYYKIASNSKRQFTKGYHQGKMNLREKRHK